MSSINERKILNGTLNVSSVVRIDSTLGITNAAAGQLAVITSVDENGRPTGWKGIPLVIEEWTFATGNGTIATRRILTSPIEEEEN